MPYHSRPITEAEISALPLRFLRLERGEEEVFTDVLLKVWFALAESGSLAALPPVPDIVSFVDDCAIFYLIFHTNPDELKLGPKDRLTSAPPSPSPKPKPSPSKASSSRSSPNKRPHPYAHARPQTSSFSPQDSSRSKARPQTAKFSQESGALSDEVIGCVYLSYSPSTQNTVDIGLALRPEARGRGFGRATITKFVRFSFEDLRVHRVVANVFGPSEINQQQSARESGAVRWIFEKVGFIPEGVQRRAAFSPAEGIWRDVYPLALLDMDWVRLCSRSVEGRTSITSPFDAMMERHNTEREEMSEWMDDPSWGRLRRVSSTETIKGHEETPAPEPEPEPERTPSPIQSESSFSLPSEHDWRSATPSEFSIVSHSPPPHSVGSPSGSIGSQSLSDNYSTFSLSPRFTPAVPDSEPTPFSMVGSQDLEPPLSPGLSTGGDVIELASLPNLAHHLADAAVDSSSSSSVAPYTVGPMPTSPSAAPYTIGPMPTTPPCRPNAFSFTDDSDWTSDSDFDGSVRGR